MKFYCQLYAKYAALPIATVCTTSMGNSAQITASWLGVIIASSRKLPNAKQKTVTGMQWAIKSNFNWDYVNENVN